MFDSNLLVKSVTQIDFVSKIISTCK